MTPYYETPRVRLYHGDTSTVLHEIPGESPGVIITDPPYFFWANVIDATEAGCIELNSEAIWMGDVFAFTLAWLPFLRHMRPGIAWMFGEPHYVSVYLRVARYMKWPLVGLWPSLREDVNDGHEEYLVAFSDAVRDVDFSEVKHALVENKYGQGKPVGMLQTLIGQSPAGPMFDPFCGSGSSLIAGLRDGRDVVGIEVNAEIAAATRAALASEEEDGNGTASESR